MSTGSSTPPGWYPDPQRPGWSRWWDGTQWTDNAQPDAGTQYASSTPPGPGAAKRSKLPFILIGAALLLAIVAAGLIVALRGGDETSPEDFAASVCEGWRDDAERMAEVVTDIDELTSEDPTNESLDELAGRFDDMADGFETLAQEVESAGIPDVPDVADGEQMVNEVVDSLREGVAAVQDGADLLAETDADDPDQLEELGTEFEELGQTLDDIGASLNEWESSELERAFDDNETCGEIDSILEDV